MKDKREESRKRQRENLDWNKNLTAVKERRQEELVKKGLGVQRNSKEGLSKQTEVLDPKLSVGVALHLAGMGLH